MISILYLGGGWPTNIGNAFIDLGNLYTLKKANDDARIGLTSNISGSFLPGALTPWNPFNLLVSRISGRESNSKRNVLDLKHLFRAQYIVISGSALRPGWLSKLPKKYLTGETKVIFNGVGGSYYNDREYNAVSEYLKKIQPFALISRDRESFSRYNEFAEHSYNGIDCAFFVPDFFRPLEIDLPEYVTATFDNMKPPEISVGNRLILRTHHSYWPYTHLGMLKKGRAFEHGKTMISDIPDDYLNLYANTAETHSDRIHACVVTLAFGNPARLYCDSPRGHLFDRINLSDIKNTVSSPDLSLLERERKHQVQFLSEVME